MSAIVDTKGLRGSAHGWAGHPTMISDRPRDAARAADWPSSVVGFRVVCSDLDENCRGGMWHYPNLPEFHAHAPRYGDVPWSLDDGLGFRLAKDPA